MHDWIYVGGFEVSDKKVLLLHLQCRFHILYSLGIDELIGMNYSPCCHGSLLGSCFASLVFSGFVVVMGFNTDTPLAATNTRYGNEIDVMFQRLELAVAIGHHICISRRQGRGFELDAQNTNWTPKVPTLAPWFWRRTLFNCTPSKPQEPPALLGTKLPNLIACRTYLILSLDNKQHLVCEDPNWLS